MCITVQQQCSEDDIVFSSVCLRVCVVVNTVPLELFEMSSRDFYGSLDKFENDSISVYHSLWVVI